MNSIIWVETLLVYTVCRTSHLRLTIHSRVMKIHSTCSNEQGAGAKVLYDVPCGGVQSTLNLKMYENTCHCSILINIEKILIKDEVLSDIAVTFSVPHNLSDKIRGTPPNRMTKMVYLP